MSQENVEAFQRGLEAGNRGDVETLLQELDPEVEWHSALHALLGGEQTVFRGHDGVREMIRDLNEAFGEFHIEISAVRDLGDRLVGIGHVRARGKGSGAETETPFSPSSPRSRTARRLRSGAISIPRRPSKPPGC